MKAVHLGQVGLLAAKNTTVTLKTLASETFPASTVGIVLEGKFTGAAATENDTEIMAYNGLSAAGLAAANNAKITGGTALKYVFATHGTAGVVREVVTSAALEQVKITVSVPAAAAGGTLDVYMKILA